MDPRPPDHTPSALQAARINRALGVFLLFFGVVVLAAVAFTETPVGRWTNLAAGLILGGIGGGMVWQSHRRATRNSSTDSRGG